MKHDNLALLIGDIIEDIHVERGILYITLESGATLEVGAGSGELEVVVSE